MVHVTKRQQMQTGGTQPKWHDPIEGMYYKADDAVNFGGCEGLAETICSDLLKKSNVEYSAAYEPELIRYRLHRYRGCKSPDFLRPGDRLVTAVDLMNQCGFDPDRYRKNKSTEEEIRDFLSIIRKATDGFDFSKALCKMLEFDQLTLNSDRNLGNVSFIDGTDGYRPILFDNGRSFATDVLLKHPEVSIEHVADSVLCMPFSKTYSLQVNAIRTICDVDSLFRTSYTKDDLEQSLMKCRDFYPSDLLARVQSIVSLQMDRYPMYFLTPERERLCKEFSELVYQHCGTSFVALPMNGDLLFRNTKDPAIQYRFSVCTKKLTCLIDHTVTPMTPPEGLSPEREKETEAFLLAIRIGCSELSLEQDQEEELER